MIGSKLFELSQKYTGLTGIFELEETLNEDKWEYFDCGSYYITGTLKFMASSIVVDE